MTRHLFVLVAFVPALSIAACGNASAPASASPAQIDIVPSSSSATPSGASTQAPPLESPPAAEAKSPKGTAAPVDAPCGGACRGHADNTLIAGISKRAKQSRRCFESALATDKTLHGHVLVHLVIGADGHVCSAQATATEKPMEAVAKCVAAYFQSDAPDARLPPPDGGCVDVNLPINFVPSQNDAGTP